MKQKYDGYKFLKKLQELDNFVDKTSCLRAEPTRSTPVVTSLQELYGWVGMRR